MHPVDWPGYLGIAPFLRSNEEEAYRRVLLLLRGVFFSSFTDGMVRNDLKQNTGKTQVIVIRDVFSHTCGSKRSDCTIVESMIMYVNGDLLGDEGRKALDACVKVKIYGRPENIPKYRWKTAWDELDKCYAGDLPRPDWMYPLPTNPWLLNDRLHHLMLPTEWDEEGNPDKEKIFDIIKIHDALIKFDEMPYVESYPKPGRGSDELKELIDKRRADVERECQEATANPDARIQYSWLVAQRRVRDCFAGSFAGDSLLVQTKA